MENKTGKDNNKMKIEFVYEFDGISSEQISLLTENIYFIDYVTRLKNKMGVDLEETVKRCLINKDALEVQYKCNKLIDDLKELLKE